MRPKISLEHWQALISVVEGGSYSRASAQLNKSQSTLSYAVSKIEEILGIKVFNLVGRKAELTTAGQVLFRQGQFLLRQASQLEEKATSLAAGWESQVSLAVEMIFPPKLLLGCLEQFAQQSPEPRIELHESVLGGTEELLEQRQVDFAICAQVPTGCVGDYLMHLALVAVAAPSHPLHQLERELCMEDLREHRQLMFRDSGTRRVTPAAMEISESRWTVSHRETSIRAASMGMGYAWFPKEAIKSELEKGELKPLPLKQGAERRVALYLAFADTESAGPAARKLAKIIREAAANPDLHE
ncbi:LysR family transcriptional regulator [Marinimicrobium locisalis]|uniref:LysR family transcriptional regulator n=1 Tax=Marinimicrobium locisalis TaxID=546022 RepID=UPI00322173A0